MKTTIKACSLLLLSLHSTAGDFVNLGFDHPILTNLAYYVPPIPAGRRLYGPVQDLLRGWTVTDGGKPYTGLMAYSVLPDGGLPYPGVPLALSSAGNYTIGKYNIDFTSFMSATVGQSPPDAVISQVGTVPKDAYYLTGVGYAFAAINGNKLTETRPTDFLLPYWDVHEYAGKEVTLSFTFYGSVNGGSTALEPV